MNEVEYKDLVYLSQSVGNPVEYTQGGGGNTSVKLDDELMAVKASGYKLKQIGEKEGYVIVNYKNIKEYHENVDLNEDRDYEKESSEYVRSNVVEVEGLKKLRPSVEAGFHSFLKKYVIHSHPVYANMLCCSKDGKDLVEKLFSSKEYNGIWLPYIDPGFRLSIVINDAIKSHIKDIGMYPEVIFMENHGIIVTADDAGRCVALHSEVNDIIKKHLNINTCFPRIDIIKLGEDKYVSRTEYLKAFVKNNKITSEYLKNVILYPDQLVYLNGNLAEDGQDSKLSIDVDSGEIVYNTGYMEALTIEETLLAYAFVIDGITSSGLNISVMSDQGIDFINNWESEAYRKSVIK